MTNLFDRDKFGKKLKAIRRNFSWTQSDLAKKTGFSQNTISNWENGNREPESIGDLLKLAEIFGVDVNYFVDGSIDEVNDWRMDSKSFDNDFLRREEFEKNTYGDHKKNLEHLAEKPELLEIYNDIYESETLQLLFDNARDLEPEDLESILIHIKGIRTARGLD